MYLKQAYNRKTGRTHLSMVYNYRDKEKGYPRTKTVETFGYLDELEKIYEDPIAHFKKLAEERNLAEKHDAAEYTITAKKNQTLEKNTANRKNYGYIVIMKLFHELGLDRFLVNRRQRDTTIQCNTSAIMKLLVISRILSPSSKRKAFDGMKRYFDFERKDTFKLEDIYPALPHFAGLSKDIQNLMQNRIIKYYGWDTELVYYYDTDYYFETPSKVAAEQEAGAAQRQGPIVQMGLATDKEGLPLFYEVFPNKESDRLNLCATVSKLSSKYESGKVIAVADTNQNTEENLYNLNQRKQWYIFSQCISGGSKEFKEYAVREDGYEWYGNEYKRKSRTERREVQMCAQRKDGTAYEKGLPTTQRQIIFYSEKYAARSKKKREAMLKKAQKIIENPSAYTKETSGDVLNYILNVAADKNTGIMRETRGKPCFNIEAIMEEEKYDGYYAIITNIPDDADKRSKFDDDKIIDIFSGIWRIEDSFRVAREEHEAHQFCLSSEDHVNSHFLTCYIALVIVRLIEKRTGYKHSAAALIEAINDLSCSYEGVNLFLFDYRSQVSDDLGKAFGVDFTKQRLTRAEIKKNLGAVKK